MLAEKKDCGKNGTYTGHKQAKNYSTGLHKSLNSSFMTTKISTSKRSSTVLPPRPPLITPWKTTKKLKKVTQTSTPLWTPQGTWARTNVDKAQAFANHLATVFQPHPPEPNSLPDDTLTSLLETPFQLKPPVHCLKVQAILNNLPPKKSLGYDLMTGKTLKELPTLCIQHQTQLFNAILLWGYFPTQWKVAQIILIPKPGKPPHQLSSYRPIRLLPIASKVFEKLLLKRLLPLVEHANLIPNHQFGLRQLNKLTASSAS
jgi:hypothetical protein